MKHLTFTLFSMSLKTKSLTILHWRLKWGQMPAGLIIVVGWLVVLGLTALLDSISVYIGPSPREGERKGKRKTREKMSKHPPPAPTASAIGPCPTISQISRTPRHWKFTQHLRTTRPPPNHSQSVVDNDVKTGNGNVLKCISLYSSFSMKMILVLKHQMNWVKQQNADYVSPLRRQFPTLKNLHQKCLFPKYRPNSMYWDR